MNFVFTDEDQARAKLTEELAELDEVMHGEDQLALEHELGDVLFASVALASIKGINAEQALRQANRRFEHRIRAVESYIKVNEVNQTDLSQADLLVIWAKIKQSET